MEKKIQSSTKSIVLFQNYKMKSKRTIVVLKYKKMLLFEEIDKNIQFNSLFLGIRETFVSVRARQVAFFIWELKKVARLKQCPLYVLTALGIRKREIYRKQTILHVSVFLGCGTWPIYAGFIVHCLIIICKYFSLSHKPDYQRSRFKYLPICFTVSVT